MKLAVGNQDIGIVHQIFFKPATIAIIHMNRLQLIPNLGACE
jgi:hypothetical protein